MSQYLYIFSTSLLRPVCPFLGFFPHYDRLIDSTIDLTEEALISIAVKCPWKAPFTMKLNHFVFMGHISFPMYSSFSGSSAQKNDRSNA